MRALDPLETNRLPVTNPLARHFAGRFIFAWDEVMRTLFVAEMYRVVFLVVW
jgi:hypothetical protein